MTFLALLLLTIAFCFAFRKAIQKAPWAFYLAAIAADIAYVLGAAGLAPHEVMVALMPLMQKCTLSLAFFFVVMGIGIFSAGGMVGRRLRPIRAELSIIACILALAHMGVYLQAYLLSLQSGASHNASTLISLVIAIVLLVLLFVLGITSFKIVKQHMNTHSWTKLQKLSYLFFALIFIHLAFMLFSSALKGSTAAQGALTVYLILFAGYGIARCCRHFKDSGFPSQDSHISVSSDAEARAESA